MGVDLENLTGWGKDDLIRQIEVYEEQLQLLRGILQIIFLRECPNECTWSELEVKEAMETGNFGCWCGFGEWIANIDDLGMLVSEKEGRDEPNI